MWSVQVKHLRTTYTTVRLPMNSVAGVLCLLTCKITSQQRLIACVTVCVCLFRGHRTSQLTLSSISAPLYIGIKVCFY